jgi:hypothetical protein
MPHLVIVGIARAWQQARSDHSSDRAISRATAIEALLEADDAEDELFERACPALVGELHVQRAVIDDEALLQLGSAAGVDRRRLLKSPVEQNPVG